MKKPSIPQVPPSEITPEQVYLHKRRQLVGATGALALLPGRRALAQSTPPQFVESSFAPLAAKRDGRTVRPDEPLSPWSEVATYGLYHEFGEGTDEPMRKAAAIQTEPWTVRVEGEVLRPRTYDVDELRKLAPLEERIHRHRCVSAWYMVVPWIGYSLAEVLRRAQPTGNAKFVEFTSYWDDKIMGNSYYRFPYIESLRLDEAMHPLTLLCFGHHGRVLPKQNGAPLRLITPWKYAHKSPKALVRIRLTEKQPEAFFYTQYGHLYGWYRNVHPDLPQAGSQRREKRVGEWVRARETPLLNGLAEQVAFLYGSELDSLR